jgi:hypothetical protein
MVDRKNSGDMQRLSARCQKRPAEIAIGGAKSDTLDRRSVGRDQRNPQMAVAHLVGKAQAMRRKNEYRIRVAGTERTGLRHEIDEVGARTPSRDRRIDR